MSVKRFVLVVAVVVCSASSALGLPLITSVVENGTGLDAQAPVVSSFPVPDPTGTSSGMANESFQFADRTHEFTNPRTTAAGVLTTANTGTLRAYPYYLLGADGNGLEYIQIANDNRAITDYSLDVTLSAAATAFLMLDNRNNGPTGANTDSNLDDPILGPTGSLTWVINDGWTRVKSGQMPNGQGDYLGSDEGSTVATADLRTHTAANNVAGPGEGLNQFYAIYRKDFPAGAHIGFTKANGITGGSTYTVAVSPTLPPILVGDVNFNGIVDGVDYGIIRDHFQMVGAMHADGDVSGDGIVNFTDFRLWKNNRTAPGSAAGFEAELLGLSGTVPEPGSLILFSWGVLSFSIATGRRR
jgi:dockerin type I repeat protein